MRTIITFSICVMFRMTLIAQQVGIGINTPSYLLDVRESAMNTTVAHFRTMGNLADILVQNGTQQVRFGTTTSGGFIGTATAHDFRFRTGGSDRMVLSAVGLLGIGTLSPGYRLDIQTEGFSSTLARFKSGGGIADILVQNAVQQIKVGVNDDGGYAGTSSTHDFRIRTGNIDRMVFKHSTGRVGIGTESPSARFHVKDSSVVFSGPNSLPGNPGPPPISGGGSRMMWYPNKAAFRVGKVSGTEWDKENIGNFSVVFGSNSTASGVGSAVSGGVSNIASGNVSYAGGGYGLLARSYGESVVGLFNTDYTPVSTDTWYINDRIFVVGNGTSFDNRSNVITALKNGRVGIGVDIPTALLEVNADVVKKINGGSWTATSDARLKQDVHDYKEGLSELLAIRPVHFRYNALSGYDTSKEHIGVIAQELQKIAPHMVSSYMQNDTEYLQVDNSAMTYMLINAVKEQQVIIEELQQQSAEMREQYNASVTMIAQLLDRVNAVEQKQQNR